MLMRSQDLRKFNVITTRKEMEWKYFLRPNICGLHQGYLRVIKYVIEFFIDSIWSSLNMVTNAKNWKVLFINFSNYFGL